jgi:CHAT domain-containing protein/tetratricopeptide (TPR) repeat protein
MDIGRNGWNNNSLQYYHRYLVNSALDNAKELKILDNLPGKFEKTFLNSIILKREQKYKEMFDVLIVCLNYKPLYFPFYDELNFSARATNQEALLRNKIVSIQDYPQSQENYLNGLIESSVNNFNKAANYFYAALKSDSANSDILYQLSYTYRNLADFEKANNYLIKALKLKGKDLWFHTKSIIAQASLFYLSQNIDAAERLYVEGYVGADEIQDKSDEAISLIDLGIVSDQKGDVNIARQKYQAAVNIAIEINDQEIKALALSELGVSFSYTNNLIESKQNYVDSFILYQETGNTARLSLLANNIGKVYASMFNYESALEYFQKGLRYAGDNKRSIALNLLGLADAYARISDFAKALNYYRQVQEISSQIKDISISADALSRLGALNYNISNFNNALKYYSSAADLMSSSADPFSKAEIYDNLGLVYLQLDSLDAAEYNYQQSFNLAVKNKDYHTESLSACDLTDFFIEKDNLNEAERYFIAAKKAASMDGSKYLAAITDLVAGKINLKKKNIGKSIENNKDAGAIAKEINDRNIQIEANYLLAKLYKSNNQESQADNYYKSAIKLIEDVSYNLFQKEDIQIAYFTSKDEVYNSYINFLLRQKRFADAFNIIDRSRSRNTMQSLVNLKLETLVEDKQTLNQLYDYNWQINSGIYTKAKTDSVTSLYNNLKLKLSAKQPKLLQYLQFENAPDLKAIQQNLNQNEYIISIYTAHENAFIFLISKNTFTPFSINISSAELTDYLKKISPYYSLGNNGQNYYNKDLFSFNTLTAHKLYEGLLKPVFEHVPENSDIIICSSPEMISVPFEFLVKSYNPDASPFNYNDKDYLIYHYNISYAPSAGVYLRQKENNLKNNGKVLLVGNPVVNNSVNSYAERRGLLEDLNSLHRNIPLLPLKYSAEEVSEISNIITTDKILTGTNATETNFKEMAPLSKIIHLSTHSFIFNKQPVIFFSNSSGLAEDGFLETGEIIKMKLNSDMVVLSSCNSGKGMLDRSEGVLGMTKAFFEAGAKSVVVSLWEVDDKYTSQLMSLFYKRLSEGYDKSQALRYAKIDFINKYSSNPYYWSAFVLSGNISQLQLKPKINSTPYLIGVLALIGMAVLLISLKGKN